MDRWLTGSDRTGRRRREKEAKQNLQKKKKRESSFITNIYHWPQTVHWLFKLLKSSQMSLTSVQVGSTPPTIAGLHAAVVESQDDLCLKGIDTAGHEENTNEYWKQPTRTNVMRRTWLQNAEMGRVGSAVRPIPYLEMALMLTGTEGGDIFYNSCAASVFFPL